MVRCRDCFAEQELGQSIEPDHKPGPVEARGIAGLVVEGEQGRSVSTVYLQG